MFDKKKTITVLNTLAATLFLLILFIVLPFVLQRKLIKRKSQTALLRAQETAGSLGLSYDDIVCVLRDIDDPEFAENIYDLGVVKEINIEEKNVEVILQTFPGCPYRIELYLVTKKSLEKIKGVGQVSVKIVPAASWDYLKGKKAEEKKFEMPKVN